MRLKSQFDSTAHRIRTQKILDEVRRRKEEETQQSLAGSFEAPITVIDRQIQEQKKNILRMLAKNTSGQVEAKIDPQL
jgi:uroporphyrinogen-III decarboxylase